MKSIISGFLQMLHCVKHDGILVMSCIAPVLCGILFKFGIPEAEKLLTGYFKSTEILFPYFALFDLFLSLITPMMFNFAAAMVILEEIDVHISGYLAVTPLGRRGYLIARLGIPSVFSFLFTMAISDVFSLISVRLETLLVTAIVASLHGLIIALMIVSFSGNKLEGMAVTKLSSLMVLGIMVPFFITERIEYLASPLPGFWMAKIVQKGGPLNVSAALLVSLVWIICLSKKFYRKISF